MPGPATGLPCAVSGGHTVAQAPLHLLVVPLSASNRYRVRPRLSTRMVPSFELAVLSEAGADLFAAGAGPMAALELSCEEPPHPAIVTAATPAAIPIEAADRVRVKSMEAVVGDGRSGSQRDLGSKGRALSTSRRRAHRGTPGRSEPSSQARPSA